MQSIFKISKYLSAYCICQYIRSSV